MNSPLITTQKASIPNHSENTGVRTVTNSEEVAKIWKTNPFPEVTAKD